MLLKVMRYQCTYYESEKKRDKWKVREVIIIFLREREPKKDINLIYGNNNQKRTGQTCEKY